MTTETRSVAEIIGWGEDGDLRAMWSDPEPDDLIAWLDERGYDVRPPYDNPITGRPVRLIVTATHRAKRNNRHWFEEEVEAPTLHAALEAAVRAVAGEAGGGEPAVCVGCDAPATGTYDDEPVCDSCADRFIAADARSQRNA